MSEALSRSPETGLCPTCGASLSSKFCPHCGEKRSSHSDLSLQHFFSHALGEMLHYDSKIFRTCRLLFTKPGFLTAEYLRGCRKPYLHPFQVFFIANLVYFLFLPYIGWSGLRTTLGIQTHMMSYSRFASRLVAERIAAKGVTLEQFSHSFDHVVDVQARSLVLVMVLLYAVLIAVLQWRKRQYFGQHLVFSLHFAAFWLTAIMIGIYGAFSLAFRIFRHYGTIIRQFQSDDFIFPLSMLVMISYVFVAWRSVYRDSIGMALLKAAILTAFFHYALDIYRFILFLIALYVS
jgi:hypothetical protein